MFLTRRARRDWRDAPARRLVVREKFVCISSRRAKCLGARANWGEGLEGWVGRRGLRDIVEGSILRIVFFAMVGGLGERI